MPLELGKHRGLAKVVKTPSPAAGAAQQGTKGLGAAWEAGKSGELIGKPWETIWETMGNQGKTWETIWETIKLMEGLREPAVNVYPSWKLTVDD